MMQPTAASSILLMAFFGPYTFCQQERRTFSTDPVADVMAQLREGWEAAGHLVGLDVTQGLPSFFSSSFNPPLRKEDSNLPPPDAPRPSLFNGFLQMLGIDSSKLNSIAANAVVFFAKMIGTSFIKNLTGGRTRRANDNEEGDGELDLDSISWAIKEFTSKATGALRGVTDPRLTDRLQDGLREAPSCVRLLACRAAPLVRAMQRALALGPRPQPQHPADAMRAWLPSRQELTRVAQECDRLVPSCRT